MSLDEQKLPLDMLLALATIVPTKDEKKLLKNFTGDIKSLGLAEQFFYSLLEVKSYEERLKSLIFKLQAIDMLQQVQHVQCFQIVC